jgi:putative phosphoesterase
LGHQLTPGINMLILGIIADTHIPDRASQLNPKAAEIFREAGVAAILHAGDICTPEVLAQLDEIAPVFAVQGNRDVWRLSHLPLKLSLEYEGVKIGLTHGHGGLVNYLTQKLSYFIAGYQFHKFQAGLRREFPQAKVIIFGHTHRSENTWSQGVLIFNPGPASQFRWEKAPASIGLLHLEAGKVLKAEIVPLG